jgi:hypothetical protein
MICVIFMIAIIILTQEKNHSNHSNHKNHRLDKIKVLFIHSRHLEQNCPLPLPHIIGWFIRPILNWTWQTRCN